jgi:hypothetical protein
MESFYSISLLNQMTPKESEWMMPVSRPWNWLMYCLLTLSCWNVSLNPLISDSDGRLRQTSLAPDPHRQPIATPRFEPFESFQKWARPDDACPSVRTASPSSVLPRGRKWRRQRVPSSQAYRHRLNWSTNGTMRAPIKGSLWSSEPFAVGAVN